VWHVGLCCVSSLRVCVVMMCTIHAVLTDRSNTELFIFQLRVMYTLWRVCCMPCLVLDTDTYGDTCDSRSALDGQVLGSAAILMQCFVIAGVLYARYGCRCLQLVFHTASHSFTKQVCM
jgi:hypothetical protein